MGDTNSAIAAGITQLGSAIVNSEGNKRAQKRAEKANIKFWNMQNKYNHPSAQRERLREANLNPNLIYGTSGNQSVGNAGDIAPAKAAEWDKYDPLHALSSDAALGQTAATTDNLREQNNVLAQESILKSAQTADLGAKTARSKFDLGLVKDLRETSLQAAQQSLKNLEQQTIGTELDNSFKDQTIKNRVSDVYYRVQNAKATLQGTQLDNSLKKLEKDLKQIGIEKHDPWYFRIFGRNLDAINEIVKESKLKP